MLGLIVTEGIEGTGARKDIITTIRHPRGITTDGERVKGIRTGTATSIAGSIVTVTGITAGDEIVIIAGTVIAIEGTIIGTDNTGIGTTKGDITTSV